MRKSTQDKHYLQRALELAQAAAAFASPNPTVGCVLVREDQLLGEGAHHYDDFDHAEIVALKQAAARGLSVQGSTAFVTLEPCSHHGRTGPCADALIAAGIGRCVVATVDPNPRVSGSGIARMRSAGIDVLVLDATRNSLAKQARRLNDAFAFSVRFDRPFVTLKAALSADGKLAPPPHLRSAGHAFWLTGEAARADVQLLRHRSDAILTGIGTILADDPLLTDRTGLGRRRPLLRVVLDSQLRTPPQSRLIQSAANDVLLLCHESADRQRKATFRELGVEIVAIAGDQRRLNLGAAVATLHGRGLRSVLIEAGSAVNGSFLAAELVDRVELYYAERKLGEDAVPFAEGADTPVTAQLKHLEVFSFHHNQGEDTVYAGYFHDPWQGS